MTGNSRPTEIPIPVRQKPTGRPATGCDPRVDIRMPIDVLAAIDRFAAKFADLDRSAAIRALVELGLRAGRKRNEVTDPKGYRNHVRKVPLAKRRPRPPVTRPPLRVVSRES
jgi:hypothetical protein